MSVTWIETQLQTLLLGCQSEQKTGIVTDNESTAATRTAREKSHRYRMGGVASGNLSPGFL